MTGERQIPWKANRAVPLAVLLALGCAVRAEQAPTPSPVASAAPAAEKFTVVADKPNVLTLPATRAKFVRLVISRSVGGAACIDELEVYGPDGRRNLALAEGGAKATASSCISGYDIHKIENLNDGQYGNGHSWIAATDGLEWAQIELPEATEVAKVVFSRDRDGKYTDRLPADFELRISADGKEWRTVRAMKSPEPPPPPPRPESADAKSLGWPGMELTGPAATYDELLRYAFAWEQETWRRVDPADPASRVLKQFAEMIDRQAANGLDVTKERAELADLTKRRDALAAGGTGILVAAATVSPAESSQSTAGTAVRPTGGTPVPPPAPAARELYYAARLAKRRLFLRDEELASLGKVLFVKRHPYEPSHNYSVILDARFRGGGGVCVLDIPRRDGRLEPADAKLSVLFDASGGIARDPVADFDARRVYFGLRPSEQGYYHVQAMNADGSDVRQLTDGPFHDHSPCPLPDGGLAFISTRCKARFLCWRPQAFVLFRMGAGGQDIRPLSYANLSEWAPSMMSDGRILWTRSEYLDKGADFGHTMWAIRPDGTGVDLVFGNNTINCYANGHEVPGTGEISCTLISHGGDLNGPIALVDLRKGRFDPAAIRSITPDVPFRTHMDWARTRCFRDPMPVGRDYFLCSHAPNERFGLYLIDRFGNRELLYLDPAIGSMAPTPLRPTPRPPVVSGMESLAATGSAAPAAAPLGQFVVADVYQGLPPTVRPGTVKYLRICQEVRSDLTMLPSGEYRKDHEPFQDFYATPVHLVNGPFGWPSYVAKGTFGLVPVEPDGSVNFLAPAGKVLYFELLDAQYNEIQRMRSVVQLQPGEKRSCIGCHENRDSTSPAPGSPPAVGFPAGRMPALPSALRHDPRMPEAPAWGAGPLDYAKTVQPVWDARCIRCHDAKHKKGLDLTATLDQSGVPASYRTLISRGLVHYFDCTWGREHTKAEALTFGSVKSKLWQVLDAGHNEIKLTPEETHRVKCWIDLNCPLWADYQYRPDRLKPASKLAAVAGGQ